MQQPTMHQSIPHLPPGVPQPTGNQQVIIYNISVPPPPGPSKRPFIRKGFVPGCTVLVARWVLAGLLWASWAIFIGGTAYAQQLCNQGYLTNVNPFGGSFGSGAKSNSAVLQFAQPMDSSACTVYLGQLWWSVWLEFFAIVVFTVANFSFLRMLTYHKLDGASVTCLYLFLMSTIQLFFIADQWQTANYLLHHYTYTGLDRQIWINAATVVTVGAILCILFNAAYMITTTYKDPSPKPLNTANLPHPTFTGPHPPGAGDAVFDTHGDATKPLYVAPADEGLSSSRPAVPAATAAPVATRAALPASTPAAAPAPVAAAAPVRTHSATPMATAGAEAPGRPGVDSGRAAVV